MRRKRNLEELTGMQTVSVAFNLDDPDERAMFTHASKRANRSAYIKRLIDRDRLGVAAAPVEEKKDELDSHTSASAGGFI